MSARLPPPPSWKPPPLPPDNNGESSGGSSLEVPDQQTHRRAVSSEPRSRSPSPFPPAVVNLESKIKDLSSVNYPSPPPPTTPTKELIVTAEVAAPEPATKDTADNPGSEQTPESTTVNSGKLPSKDETATVRHHRSENETSINISPASPPAVVKIESKAHQPKVKGGCEPKAILVTNSAEDKTRSTEQPTVKISKHQLMSRASSGEGGGGGRSRFSLVKTLTRIDTFLLLASSPPEGVRSQRLSELGVTCVVHSSVPGPDATGDDCQAFR